MVFAPLKRYLDNRFDLIEWRLLSARDQLDAVLARVDVSEHNAAGAPPSFDSVVSQVVSAAQFSYPDFQRLRGVLFPGVGLIPCGAGHVPSTSTHRKLWEWCYILRAAEQHGR